MLKNTEIRYKVIKFESLGSTCLITFWLFLTKNDYFYLKPKLNSRMAQVWDQTELSPCYEVIVSPKIWTRNVRISALHVLWQRTGQIFLQFFVHILGEMMTSWIHCEIYWPLACTAFYCSRIIKRHFFCLNFWWCKFVQVILFEISCNFLHKFTWIVLSVHKLNKVGKFWSCHFIADIKKFTTVS